MGTGIRYMLISVGCFAAVNLMVKFLPHLPATELVLFRSLITFAISYTLLKRKHISPWGVNKKWLLIRGLAGTTALTVFFYTIQKMPLSAAVTVQYLSPFFTAFIAGFLLGERTRWAQWFFFLVSFATPVMIVFSLFNWVTPALPDLALLFAIGVMTQFAQLYMTKSYQLSEVNTVAPLKYIGVIFALTWDIVLFDFVPNGQMFLGIALVIGGVLLNLRFKARLKRSHTRTAA